MFQPVANSASVSIRSVSFWFPSGNPRFPLDAGCITLSQWTCWSTTCARTAETFSSEPWPLLLPLFPPMLDAPCGRRALRSSSPAAAASLHRGSCPAVLGTRSRAPWTGCAQARACQRVVFETACHWRGVANSNGKTLTTASDHSPELCGLGLHGERRRAEASIVFLLKTSPESNRTPESQHGSHGMMQRIFADLSHVANFNPRKRVRSRMAVGVPERAPLGFLIAPTICRTQPAVC